MDISIFIYVHIYTYIWYIYIYKYTYIHIHMIFSGQWGCWTRRASPAASQRTSPRASAPPRVYNPVFCRPSSHRTTSKSSYRDTSLIRNSALLGSRSRTMHRASWWFLGGGRVLMSEVSLYWAEFRYGLPGPGLRLRWKISSHRRGWHALVDVVTQASRLNASREASKEVWLALQGSSFGVVQHHAATAPPASRGGPPLQVEVLPPSVLQPRDSSSVPIDFGPPWKCPPPKKSQLNFDPPM